MKVKMILPALTEAKSPFWRPIKYSLFPPLGLATLAAYLDEKDEVTLQDEHVETLDLDDEADLVVIQVYITSAYRAYQIADHYRAKGAHVCLGGLHVTSLPEEARLHADTIFLGPGEDTWPAFLRDFRARQPKRTYVSEVRTLADLPFPRRDLIKRHLYLVPNSLVVSRGCPHVCDFCYKEAFFEGGKSFYTLTVDRALAEIETATFHILTPYPGTALYQRMQAEARITTSNWDLYDTRHTVFRPQRLTAASLETGYWQAYREFYRWKNIIRSSRAHEGLSEQLRHMAYAGGWKKFEPLWDWVIRMKRVSHLLPMLETILAGFASRSNDKSSNKVTGIVEQVEG